MNSESKSGVGRTQPRRPKKTQFSIMWILGSIFLFVTSAGTLFLIFVIIAMPDKSMREIGNEIKDSVAKLTTSQKIAKNSTSQKSAEDLANQDRAKATETIAKKKSPVAADDADDEADKVDAEAAQKRERAKQLESLKQEAKELEDAIGKKPEGWDALLERDLDAYLDLIKQSSDWLGEYAPLDAIGLTEAKYDAMKTEDPIQRFAQRLAIHRERQKIDRQDQMPDEDSRNGTVTTVTESNRKNERELIQTDRENDAKLFEPPITSRTRDGTSQKRKGVPTDPAKRGDNVIVDIRDKRSVEQKIEDDLISRLRPLYWKIIDRNDAEIKRHPDGGRPYNSAKREIAKLQNPQIEFEKLVELLGGLDQFSDSSYEFKTIKREFTVEGYLGPWALLYAGAVQGYPGNSSDSAVPHWFLVRNKKLDSGEKYSEEVIYFKELSEPEIVAHGGRPRGSHKFFFVAFVDDIDVERIMNEIRKPKPKNDEPEKKK